MVHKNESGWFFEVECQDRDISTLFAFLTIATGRLGMRVSLSKHPIMYGVCGIADTEQDACDLELCGLSFKEGLETARGMYATGTSENEERSALSSAGRSRSDEIGG